MGPDFSKYDAATLQQVLGTVDAARFPERVAEINARLAQLERDAPLLLLALTAPPSVDRSRDLPILCRAGAVLIAIGVLGIAVRMYAIAHGALLVDVGPICTMLAGVFLWRGSMRAAALVRWLAWASLLPTALYLMLTLLLLQPWDLTVTQWRLAPASMLVWASWPIGYGAVLFWLAQQLGRTPVLAARVAAQRPLHDMRIPLALGVALAIGMTTLLAHVLAGARAGRAETMVAAKLGAGYRYHANAIHVMSLRDATSVNATVVVWNASTILTVPVHWQE